MPSSSSSSSSLSLLGWATAALAAFGPVVVHASSLPGGDTGLLGRQQQHRPRFSPNEDAAAAVGLAAAGLMPRAVTNLQTFSGALAGVSADEINQSNDVTRQYDVSGDTFADYTAAVDRSCDNQHNSCADAANSATSSSVNVSDCDTQNSECKAAASSATQTAFIALSTTDANFEYFCEV